MLGRDEQEEVRALIAYLSVYLAVPPVPGAGRAMTNGPKNRMAWVAGAVAVFCFVKWWYLLFTGGDLTDTLQFQIIFWLIATLQWKGIL